MIAARVAMRALPTLKGVYDQRYDNAGQLTLATFHSCAISWIAVAGDGRSVTYSPYSRHSIYGAYSVYVAAVEAATAATRAGNTTAKVVNAAAYAIKIANIPDVMWRLVQEDANGIENGVSIEGLARTPFLSLHTQPERRSVDFIAPTSLSALLDDWNDLKSILLDRNQDWNVWIDWYEDCLHGKPQNTAFENALLTLTDEEWEQEPAVVNAQLKELMEVHESGGFGLISQKIAVPASDRVVSVRDNQEPFDALEKSLDQIRNEFAQSSSHLRSKFDTFNRHYLRNNFDEYDRFEESYLQFKEYMAEGYVKLNLLLDNILPFMRKLADFCKYAGIIGGGLWIASGNGIEAIQRIIAAVGG